MQISMSAGCNRSSSSLHLYCFRSSLPLFLVGLSQIIFFSQQRRSQSSISLQSDPPAPAAHASCPSAFVRRSPCLPPSAAAAGTNFPELRPHFAASSQVPSATRVAAALRLQRPVVLIGAGVAAAVGDTPAVHLAASAPGAHICADPDRDGVPSPELSSGSFHTSLETCRHLSPLQPPSSLEQHLFHEQDAFAAARASAASCASASTIRGNSRGFRSNPSPPFSPPGLHSVPAQFLSVRYRTAFPASLLPPLNSVCSAFHRLLCRILPALASYFTISLLWYSASAPLFAAPTGGQTLFSRRTPSLNKLPLSAAAAVDTHYNQHRWSSSDILLPPPPATMAAGSVSLVQTLGGGVASLTPVVLPTLPTVAAVSPSRGGSSSLSPYRPSPAPWSPAWSARPDAAAVATAVAHQSSVLQVVLYAIVALSSGLPSLLYVTAEPRRPRAHAPPGGGGHRHNNLSTLEDTSSGVARTEGGESSYGPSVARTENPTVMRTAPTIRPRRRVPGRRSSSDWQQLFSDLRLVDMALPATLHSALTDVNSVKYFELAVAQKVPVSRQLLDGIRMFDVRAWKDEQDGQWYSEVPWRLEDDFRLLREYAPTAEEASTSSFVSSMLRSLPLPLRPGKDRGRKGQQGGEKRAGGRKVPNKVLSLVDLHSWTSLEDGLFKPIQDFLRTHISEVAVVVVSSFNGNRKTAMNAVPHAASLASSLERLAARQQQRQQEGTAAGSSSSRLEGHPFHEEFLLRGGPSESGSAVENDRSAKQQQARTDGSAAGTTPDARGGVAGGVGAFGPTTAAGGYAEAGRPVLSPGSMYTSPAYLDSLGASPATYEVLDPLDTSCSFYMSSAVRKPLTYADVASFMALVDKYWGQLLPRHSHVFSGPAGDSAYRAPPGTQAPRAQPIVPSGGSAAVVGVPPGATASPTAPGSAADAGPTIPQSGPAGPGSPTAAATQQPASTGSPRSLAAIEKAYSATNVPGMQVSLPPTPAAVPQPPASGSVGGSAARSAAAVEAAGAGELRHSAREKAADQRVAPAATKVGGAPERTTATTDQRQTTGRPAAPPAAAAPRSRSLDTRSAGGRAGATAAMFSAGLDDPPGPTFLGAEEDAPRGARTGTADAASTLFEGASGAPSNTRGVGSAYGNSGAPAGSSVRIDSYPMYESLHRPHAFAEWLRTQGDLLLAKATLKDLLDARIRLLLFVDDPLIAWYLTAFSREHVIVFVAADHTYDVLYKSEALFGPCALPNRASAAPSNLLLNVSREATWASCRERCESTPAPPVRPDEGRLVAKLRAARGRLGGPMRDPNNRSCTYWTFEPPMSLGSAPLGANGSEEIYSLGHPASEGFLPYISPRGGSKSDAKADKGGEQKEDGGRSFSSVDSATPPELQGECRTYTGMLTLADTVPLHGSIIQPRSCALRTLYELPTQWASAAVFADLSDAVCPIFEVAPRRRTGIEDAVADPDGRAGGDTLGEAAAGSGKDERQQKEPRSYQFFPELCMLDATPRSLRDPFQDQEEDDSIQLEDPVRANSRRLKGAGLERKLLRVYFSPPSPVPFVDGTRGGRREVGPVDAVSLMNELTATWALWQLERQQLVSSLTVLDTVEPAGLKEDTYPYDQPRPDAAEGVSMADGSTRNSGGWVPNSGGGGSPGGSRNKAGYSGGGEPHILVGRERPRATRPVNALMVMRYDQTKSLIKNFSHLNYFEIIMNLNPQPKETRAIFFQSGEGAELSADRYVKVTAILNSLGMDDELGEISELEAGGFDTDDTTEEEKRAQTLTMWLAISAAIVCFLIVVIGSTLRTVFSKRVPRGGWTAAATPQRASAGNERAPQTHPLENLS